MVGAKLMQRISEFRATDSLSEISHLPPPRLHSLGGDRNGEFAVSLTGNERLVFKGLDINNEFTSNKSQVVKIYILEVVDYHGN